MEFNLRTFVADLVQKEKQRQRAELETRQAERDHYENLKIEVWDAFLKFCRPAKVDDYLQWLMLYIQNNGTARVRYFQGNLEDQPVRLKGGFGPGIEPLKEDVMARIEAGNAKLHVLTGVPKGIPVAHGALSFSVIVPTSIELPNFNPNRVGHSTFYFMKDGSTNASWVKIYTDVAQSIMMS